MRRHIDIVAYLFIAYGALVLFSALALGGLLGAFGEAIRSQATTPEAAAAGAGTIVGVLGTLGLLALAGGWGLLKRKPWARIVVLVVAFMSLLGFPVGTLVGGYAIWVLMSADSRRIFSGDESRTPLHP